MLAKTASSTHIYRRIVKRTQPAFRCHTIKHTLTQPTPRRIVRRTHCPACHKLDTIVMTIWRSFAFGCLKHHSITHPAPTAPHIDASLRVHNAPHVKA
jgi:hypothetical protein